LGTVVPLGKHLFQPFHDGRKFHAFRRLDIKRKPVIPKTQTPNLENKPHFRLMEDRGKEPQSPRLTEQGFPVVDTGVDFVPYPLFE
jgi:hypothetical protein